MVSAHNLLKFCHCETISVPFHVFFFSLFAEEPLPFSLLLDVEKNLEMALNESFSKYDLDYQIKEATGILSLKMTSLECKYC